MCAGQWRRAIQRRSGYLLGKGTGFGVMVFLGLLAGWQPGSLPAQNTPASTGQVDRQVWLDRLLQYWQREAARTVKLQAQFEATRKFNNFGGVVKSYQGLAKFMRLPDNAYGLLIQLVEKDQPQRYERYLCTGTHFYIFRPEEKTVYFHTLPPRKANEVPDQGPMSFLFGISADEAKKRYKMQITQQDEWYTYVQIEPLFPKDQVDFLYARLAVLNKPTRAIPQYYPRQIYWVEPQKVEVTWDMVQLLQNESATQVERRDFAAPQIPSGWQLKPIQQPSQPNQPSVVRPQQ
jgi:TIGR03009 family protein